MNSLRQIRIREVYQFGGGLHRGLGLIAILAFAWQLRRGFASLLLCRQLGHNGLLPISVYLLLDPVVKRGKGDVGLEKIGGRLHQGFELLLSEVEIPLGQVKGGNLKKNPQVAGAHLQSVLEKSERLIVLLLFLQGDSQIQVGVEVVGI